VDGQAGDHARHHEDDDVSPEGLTYASAVVTLWVLLGIAGAAGALVAATASTGASLVLLVSLVGAVITYDVMREVSPS
jgi:hypothetical protein